MKSIPFFHVNALLAYVSCWCLAGLVHAQDVRALSLLNVPPDLIQDGAAPSAAIAPHASAAPAHAGPVVDLGERPASSYRPAAADSGGAAQQAASPARSAARAAQAASAGNLRRVTPMGDGPAAERAVFAREPIRIPLPIGRERLITLPAPAALHVPDDIESVMRLEIIDRTIYARALVPFTTLRVVAELIDSGQQIPLDLEANAATARATAELEISVLERAGAPALAPAGSATAETAAAAAPDADMVQLTRYAARMLYAPRRLAQAAPNVHQVALETKPVSGLMRGVHVETVPLGQWKSGALYVTALRVTNLSRVAVELPLDNLRGRWIAATAQHGRLGPAGTEVDTTAIYLVCDRAFEACL